MNNYILLASEMDMLNMVVNNDTMSYTVKLDISESPLEEYTILSMRACVGRCMCFPNLLVLGLHMVYILDYVFESHFVNCEFVADVLV